MTNENKIFQLIGLACKAGRIVSGEEMCERAIRSGKAVLMIITEDASDNTKKKFRNMCKFREVEMLVMGDKETLGKFTGKSLRVAAAITDCGFARKIKMLSEITDTGV